jgi:hypothetical protein
MSIDIFLDLNDVVFELRSNTTYEQQTDNLYYRNIYVFLQHTSYTITRYYFESSVVY